MKAVLSFLFFLICIAGSAQTSFLKEAVVKLDKALLAKDTNTLKQLLHKEVSYGHSNAWIQTKTQVMNDFASGKILYSKIEQKDQVWQAAKDWATVRSTTMVDYLLEGKPGSLKMHVLQVWLKTNKGWQLLARQSTKLLN